MTHISSLMNILHSFTPKGQELLLAELKSNKKLLATDFGFVKLPSLFAKANKTTMLQNELLNKSNTLDNIVVNELEKLSSSNATAKIEELSKNYKQGCVMNGIMGTKGLRQAQEQVFSINLGQKKQGIVDYIRKQFPNGLIVDGENLTTVAQNANAYELRYVVNKIIENVHKKYNDEVGKLVNNKGKQLFHNFDCMNLKQRNMVLSNLEIRQAICNNTKKSNDDLFEILKIISSKSSDKRVLEIEQRLKQEYNLKYVNLYDLENAQKVEAGLKLAKGKVELPENILVTPIHFDASQTGRHLGHTNGTNTILLNPIEFDTVELAKSLAKDCEPEIKEKFLAQVHLENFKDSSTHHPAHTVIHEICHNENPFLMPSVLQTKFDTTIEKLSGYAKDSAKHGKFKETLTELKTKEVVNGYLPQDEKALEDFLS